MKFLTIILSIYILGLSLVTCNDNEVQDTTNNDTEHIVGIDRHQDSGEADLCSPFCSCQCCQISIDTVDFGLYKLSMKDYFGPVYFYQDTTLQNFAYSLFQPPQV